MFVAPTWSALAVKPHAVHWNLAWVRRLFALTCPRPPAEGGQVREVLRAFTGITSRPALSALSARIRRNCPQPASRMPRLSPALAAAPLGRNAPSFSGSGLGLGARVMPAVFS